MAGNQSPGMNVSVRERLVEFDPHGNLAITAQEIWDLLGRDPKPAQSFYDVYVMQSGLDNMISAEALAAFRKQIDVFLEDKFTAFTSDDPLELNDGVNGAGPVVSNTPRTAVGG